MLGIRPYFTSYTLVIIYFKDIQKKCVFPVLCGWFFSFHSCISVIISMNSCNLSAGLHLCIFGSAFSGKQVPFAKGSRGQLRRNNFSDEGFNFIAQICKCTNNIEPYSCSTK